MTKTPSVNKLVLRGNVGLDHVYVSSDGVLTTGVLETYPGGAFIIRVSNTVQNQEAFHASLKRLVRNCLSAYPIVDIEDGGGLPFDLKAWLREHSKDL